MSSAARRAPCTAPRAAAVRLLRPRVVWCPGVDWTPLYAVDYSLPDDDDALLAECEVETFRSGGAGGQHQNMTDSGVRLRHRPTGAVVVCRGERSQLANKRICLRRLRLQIERLLAPPPAPRRPTKPGAAAGARRLEEKARRSRTKRLRRPPGEGE